MISLYHVNYPALTCLLILIAIYIRHLWKSRYQEFETTVMPSSLNMATADRPVSIWSEKDVVINCPIKFEHISCRSFLTSFSIRMDRVVPEG